MKHPRIAESEQENFSNRLTWWLVIDNDICGNGYVDYMLPEVEGCGVDAAMKSRCCTECRVSHDGSLSSSRCRIGTALRKLAAYEDTGLTPFEVFSLKKSYNDVVNERFLRDKEEALEYKIRKNLEMKDQGSAVAESVDENKEALEEKPQNKVMPEVKKIRKGILDVYNKTIVCIATGCSLDFYSSINRRPKSIWFYEDKMEAKEHGARYLEKGELEALLELFKKDRKPFTRDFEILKTKEIRHYYDLIEAVEEDAYSRRGSSDPEKDKKIKKLFKEAWRENLQNIVDGKYPGAYLRGPISVR